MFEEFEYNVLECGHTPNTYKSPGICQKCDKQFCERCLQLFDYRLLCPICTENKMEEFNWKTSSNAKYAVQ